MFDANTIKSPPDNPLFLVVPFLVFANLLPSLPTLYISLALWHFGPLHDQLLMMHWIVDLSSNSGDADVDVGLPVAVVDFDREWVVVVCSCCTRFVFLFHLCCSIWDGIIDGISDRISECTKLGIPHCTELETLDGIIDGMS